MSPPESIEWLIEKIQQLPSDEEKPPGTAGYNCYTTQKAHWLGWLTPNSPTGSYQRAQGERGARDIYNRIVEPKMLLWLIEAAGVAPELVSDARLAALAAKPALASKAAAVRRVVPWSSVFRALGAWAPCEPC